MSAKPASPFSGIRLSNQTMLADRGSDQQLFTPAPAPAPRSAPTTAQQPTHLPKKEGSQEPRKVGTQINGNPVGRSSDEPSSSAAAPLFDINAPATEKNSYMFSEDELWALRDVEAELERTYRTDVSKYNIIRLGLHYLLEDYKEQRQYSFLVRRLGLKNQ